MMRLTPIEVNRNRKYIFGSLRVLQEGAVGGEWSGWLDSNQRPLAPKASALPGCATPRHGAGGEVRTPDPLFTEQQLYQLSYTSLVAGVGIEPTTFGL